ncbi:ty3-gypsy retrotransposon protein [Tanacetum coccineum]
MDEAAVRALMKDQSDVFHAELHTQLVALHVELQEIKGLGLTRHGAGDGDPGLPLSMPLEVPKFNGIDPERWIFAIHEYFDLLGTAADQRLKVVGFNLEGTPPNGFDGCHGALFKLLQLGSMTQYQSMKPSLQRELLVSKPTTLGDAFSLARVTEARFEDQGMAPALLPTPPKPSSNAGTTPLPIKWISPAERQERLSKGLCFNCDNKWVRGHKYPGKFLLLMANDADDADQATPEAHNEALESRDISILNSLGLSMEVDLYVLPMKEPDVVLGIQWLQKLGKLETDEVYRVYELHSVAVQDEGIESTQVQAGAAHPEIKQLLVRFEALFQVPTTLPPHRLIDHLRDSHSPFTSPVLLVKKKDDSYHFGVDYRSLNAVTVKDKFPIPMADEVFDEVGGAVILNSCDTLTAHMDHLQRVFQCLQDHQFYVKRSKCVFGATTLEYLGHVILGRGIEMDPKKLVAIVNWPVPKAQRQVRGFLGLVRYYRWFIKDYVSIATPLSNLLEKDAFKWETVEATTFEALKHQISHAPILGLHNFDETFIVETNASATGIGQCYCKKINTLYKHGVSNQVADALSHMYKEDEGVTTTFMAMSQPLVDFLAELRGENEVLEELQHLHQKIDQGEELVGFRHEQGLLIYQDRYYIGAESKLKRAMLLEFHNTPSMGHGGIKKMLMGLSALFFWKGMHKSVEEYVKQCLVCQQTKYATQAPGGLLQPLPTPTAIWEYVSMDFITRLLVFKGLTVIFVVVDRFSKYAHFGTLPTSFNAPNVAELFVEMVVKHHGFPHTVMSYRDPIFETDISQKDEKPSKKRQNRTRDGKVCEDEAQSKSRTDYANLGNFIYKRKKGEKGNEKKKDVEGLFLYKSQTSP